VSLDRNKQTVRSAIEIVWNREDCSGIERYAIPDLLVYAPHRPEPYRGTDGLRELVGMVHGSFPDHRVEIRKLVAEGDTVAALLRWTGTNSGELMGLPPTGRSVDMEEMNFYRLAPDGKIAELRALQNMASMMSQLGLGPAGPPPKPLVMLLRARHRLRSLRLRASAG
jgi:steroid delta-isomerase-like uncharacterized protein